MHTYEEYNKPIQELIKIMEDDYPHDFVLEIGSFGAELKSDISVRTFLKDNNELEKGVDWIEFLRKVFNEKEKDS